MNPDDKFFQIAGVIVILAILNWIAGNRALFGMPIVMRSGAFWVACRWLGLGLFVASAAAGEDRSGVLSWIGLIGAIVMLVGTARKRSNTNQRKT